MEDDEKGLADLKQMLKAIEQTPYFEWLSSLADQFQVVRDKATAEGYDEMARRAQFEIEVFCLQVRHPFINRDAERRFVGRFGYSDGSNWPDVTSFTEEQMRYYETRLFETQNRFLKARYADLLFDRWTKDRQLNKFELGSLLCHLLLESGHHHLAHGLRGLFRFLSDVARAAEVALILSNQELLRKAITPIFRVLGDLHGDRLRWVYEISLVLKGISKSSLGTSLSSDQYERIVKQVDEARKFFWEQKEHISWHREFCKELLYWGKFLAWDDGRLRLIQVEIGRSFEEEAEYARDHRNSHMLEARFLEEALAHYMNIGHAAKFAELKRRIQQAYSASKGEYQKKSYTIEVPMEAESRFLEPYEELDLDGCLGLAGSDPRLVIQAESVGQAAEKFRDSSPLLFWSSKFVVDQDRKIFQADSEEASLKYVGDLEYKLRLVPITEAFLKSLFRFLIEHRGLTGEGLSAFLNGWPLLDGTNARIIEVGLKRFFDADYVSALHVLVPQLEACVRKMFAKAGMATTSIKKRVIQHEQTFNEFLERDEVKEVLGKDLHKYLQMVMVDPLALNLRNDIAHGLIKPSQCNESNALIIIHLFLILTRFRLVQQG